jgi:hypothetical protein
MTDDFRLAEQEFDPAVPIANLQEHPDNYNFGDIGAISESLDAHGFYGAIVAQKATGYILAGNHRYRAARMKNARTLPVFWLDCDDDEARRLLAVDNRTSRLASFDESKLIELLTLTAESQRGLVGTGYDGDDLDDMISKLNRPLNLGGSSGEGDAPTGAKYAEDPEDEEQRKAAIGGYRDRKDGGALVEMILVFTVPQRAEVADHLDAIRRARGGGEMRAADAVLRALRVTKMVLNDERDAALAEAKRAEEVQHGDEDGSEDAE